MPSIEIPTSMIADCPASGTSVGFGSVIEPVNVGWVELVMLSPTMFESLAADIASVPFVIDEGVVLMMNVS